MSVVWFDVRPIDGLASTRIGRDGPVLVAEWDGIGRLSVPPDLRPVFEPFADATPVQVAKIENGIARLLVRSLHGHVGLHSSAVALSGKAALFIGHSTAGKSTLAAAMCHRSEAELLADDATALEVDSSRWWVLPGETAHWIDERATTVLGFSPGTENHGKRLFPARAAEKPVALAAIIDLIFDEAPPRLERLSVADAMAALIPQVVRFAVDDETLVVREMHSLVDLLGSVAVFRLVRPRDLHAIDATVAQVAALLRDDGGYASV